MRLRKFSRDRYRVLLDKYEYNTLVNNAPNEVGTLAIRLAGEVGLKVSEIMNVEMHHVEQSEEVTDAYFLRVPLIEEDKDKSYIKGRPRKAYLTDDMHDLLQNFMQDNGLTHQEKLIQVTKRTVQKYVKDAANKSAEKTSINEFEKVSILDLRIFFAKDAIERLHIHPLVVMKVGGWERFDTLEENLEQPDEVKIIREFDRVQ